MGKRVSSYVQRPARAPASRLFLVSISWAKQLHGLRRMWGFGLSAHLVWGCGGAIEGAIRSPFRRAAPLSCD